MTIFLFSLSPHCSSLPSTRELPLKRNDTQHEQESRSVAVRVRLRSCKAGVFIRQPDLLADSPRLLSLDADADADVDAAAVAVALRASVAAPLLLLLLLGRETEECCRSALTATSHHFTLKTKESFLVMSAACMYALSPSLLCPAAHVCV